jgi:hypothetical protein
MGYESAEETAKGFWFANPGTVLDADILGPRPMRSERAGEELRTFSIRTASVVEHRAGDIHDVVKHPFQERRKHGNDRARAWSANEVMPSGSVQKKT